MVDSLAKTIALPQFRKFQNTWMHSKVRQKTMNWKLFQEYCQHRWPEKWSYWIFVEWNMNLTWIHTPSQPHRLHSELYILRRHSWKWVRKRQPRWARKCMQRSITLSIWLESFNHKIAQRAHTAPHMPNHHALAHQRLDFTIKLQAQSTQLMHFKCCYITLMADKGIAVCI